MIRGYRTIGVVGGGQLCRMMGEEARRKELPFDLIALDPTPDCPARPFLKDQIVGDFKDPDLIRKLAGVSDILTYEIELANSDVLEEIERLGKVVAPRPATLRIIQDKLAQKSFLEQRRLPVPEFKAIGGREDLVRALGEFGYPAMLKARRDSYDGRGNFLIGSADELEAALKHFDVKALMVERFVEFEMEISVIAARSAAGEVKTFPVGENIHQENILDMTIVPARVDDRTARRAEEVAAETLRSLGGPGVFCIEMFVDRKGGVLINEIAPRVHNSGHYTIEACRTSQFEQHLRAIGGMPLGDVDLLYPAVMINIIGEPGYRGPFKLQGVESAGALPGVSIHDYGKREVSPKRKIGHVTLTAVDSAGCLDDLVKRAREIRERIRISRT